MSEIPPGLTQADLDLYAKIDDGMKKLQDEKDRLNALIKKTHSDRGTGTYIYGKVVVTIGSTSKVNYEGIAKENPFEVAPEYYIQKIDPKKVPASTKNRFTTTNLTLSVKLAD